MNSYAEDIKKFHLALPEISNWIDQLLKSYEGKATYIINLNFPRINKAFPRDFLERAKVVIVKNKVPVPPLSKMGLHKLSKLEQIPLLGITYKDTFFVDQCHRTENLHFHELVHVVQWERLGVENFLLAYGVGFLQFGYENSPLEQMAYTLERDFDLGIIPNGIIGLIQLQTDTIWSQVTPLVTQ